MGRVSDPKRAQSDHGCIIYRLEGGVRELGWSPGVLGTLNEHQIRPPIAGQPHRNPFDSPNPGENKWDVPEEGRPKPGEKLRDGTVYNPGVCAWVDYQGGVKELVEFFECQATKAVDCAGTLEGSGLRGTERNDAFDKCFTRAMDTCDPILEGRVKAKEEAAVAASPSAGASERRREAAKKAPAAPAAPAVERMQRQRQAPSPLSGTAAKVRAKREQELAKGQQARVERLGGALSPEERAVLGMPKEEEQEEETKP